MPTSNRSKWIFSSAAVLVVAGIVLLSTGAQNPSSTPSAKVAATQSASAAVPAQPVIAKTESSAAAPASSTANESASYMEIYGWLVGQQAGFEMGFTPAEKEALLKGLSNAAAGQKAPAHMKELFPKMQEYLSTKEKAFHEAQLSKMAEEAKVHIADGQKYLAEIAKTPGVEKSKSGLYYKIEVAGNSKKPAADDTVTIHYTGKLIDGTVFDSSVERGQPVDLPLYGVIPGFSEGLGLIGEGGKATLYISSELGYGNQAAGPIPPGSTLIFTVELIKIQPKQVAEAPKADAAPAVEVKADAKATTK